MKKTAYIARTAHDLDHVNRLRVPEFSIKSLWVKASGKQSKTYWPEWAFAPAAPSAGSDDFHFCPEKEIATIEYEVDNPYAIVGEARFELFCRFQKKPLWTLKLSKMGDDTWIHGKHSISWDGRVFSADTQAGIESAGVMGHDFTKFKPDDGIHDDFPDGYITLEDTPYKLKLTLIDDDDSDQIAVAWTYFQILVKGFEFELGPVETIPSAGLFGGDRHQMDKTVHAAVKAAGGVPASGAAALQVPLASNLFKYKHWFTDDGSEMDDNTAFSVYKDLWDDGPRLPVFAKIRLAASDDSVVKLEAGLGAKAIGNARFLWDWLDAAPAAGVSATPIAFLASSANYDKNKTTPKGTNCHVDRGGKRGPKAEPVFPEQGGYSPRADLKDSDFPFKVEACKTRTWAAFSRAWTKGKLMGRTGVLFRPARMAGDGYKLVVYAAWDHDASKKYVLDKVDEPLNAPVAITNQTGSFEVWREIHLARYYRKQLAIPDFVAGNLAALQAPFAEMFVNLVDKMTAADKLQIPAAGYNTMAEDALASAGNAMIDNQLMVLKGANHSGTQAEFLIETYANFRINVQNWMHTKFPANPNPAALANAWLAANGYPGNYIQDTRDILDNGPADKLVEKLKCLDGAKDGVTIVHFNFAHSLDAASGGAGGTSLTLGEAVNVPGSTRSKCLFNLWSANANVFCHEVGHHIFLPHSPFPPGFMPGGAQAERHDAADNKCMMTYNWPMTSFCGLCQLRVRGWDPGPNDPANAKLKKNGASNQRL